MLLFKLNYVSEMDSRYDIYTLIEFMGWSIIKPVCTKTTYLDCYKILETIAWQDFYTAISQYHSACILRKTSVKLKHSRGTWIFGTDAILYHST